MSTLAYQLSNRTVLAESLLSNLARTSEHVPKVLVVGLAITTGALRVVEAKVDGVEITFLPTGVDQVDHPDAAHESAGRATVLKFDHVDLFGVAFILHAVIDNKATVGPVVKQGLHHFPQRAGGEFFAAQEVTDGVVAGAGLPVQMVCQIGAGVVAAGRADQVLDVLLLGHARGMAAKSANVKKAERKS